MSLIVTPPLSGILKPATGGGGGVATLPAFPALSAWARWEPGRETTYSDGDDYTTLTDWSGNNRHWNRSSGALPEFKTNVLNGHAVADAAIVGTASGWDLGPDMSSLTEVHALMVLEAQSDPALDIGETIIWNVGTSGIASHVPYVNGLIFEGAFSTTRRDSLSKTLNLASAFFLLEIISTATEWTLILNGTETVHNTGINTVAAPASPHLLQGCRHKMAGGYIFPAKLSGGNRTTLINYFNGATAFNQGWS